MNQLDWEGLRLLRAVQDAGSLRGAARSVAVSQPTLGRRLDALEAQLGVPLLVRHARGVHLTAEGEAAAAVADEVAASVESLQRQLTGRVTQVEGRVRLSCTEPVAMYLLPAPLGALRCAHPRLAIDVVVDAHASDLPRREADLAVRMFAPQQADLVARRVGTTRTCFYGAPSYFAQRSRPRTLQDLLQHEVIGPDRDPLFVRQAEALGVDLSHLAFRTDGLALVAAWVRAGLAIGALLEPAAAGLVQVLEPLIEHPVWLVAHPDVRRSAAVSAVWDRLAADLPDLLRGSPASG